MSFSADVGTRLKNRRKEAQLTLKDLAARTGLTASFLSQVERGKVNLSLASLQKIAQALDVPVLNLLADDSAPVEGRNAAAVIPDRPRVSPVVSHGQRPSLHLPETGLELELLANHMGKKMVAYKERLEPGMTHQASRLREPTEEVFYILTGTLQMEFTYGQYCLETDDSIYFDGEDLIRISNPSPDKEVVWIGVITPPVF